jgi:signal transduction histidine kinase
VKSIRTTLTLTLWAATGLLLLFAAAFIFLATRQILFSQFDETLTAKTQALIAAAEVDGKELEFDFTVEDFAGFGPNAGGDYFEVRRSDGSLVIASPSLGTSSLPTFPIPTAEDPEILSANLSDGRPARFLIRPFLPYDDKKARFTDLHIIVASQSMEINRSLTALGIVLLITFLGATALTIPVVRIALTRGLRPLDQLGREVQQIRTDLLEKRITETGLPAELSTVASRINALLARIESSFERERRFSSHAAHELRTPLAELKTIAEMGAQWPDQANPERCSEMLTVISELEALLEKLSLLSRADAGRLPLQPTTIHPATLLTTITDRFQPAAATRNLTLTTHPHPTPLHTDPVILTTLLNNLVGNATTYAPPGSTISIHLSPAELLVENPAPNLSPADVPHLFERFWRKDPGRSGYGHSGLGLSIVQSCATVIGATCTAALVGETLQIRIRFPQENP